MKKITLILIIMIVSALCMNAQTHGIQLGPCISGISCIQVQGIAQTANGGTAISNPTGSLFYRGTSGIPLQLTPTGFLYYNGTSTPTTLNPSGFLFFNGTSSPLSMNTIPFSYLTGVVAPSGTPTNGQYAQWTSSNTLQGISTIPYSNITGGPSTSSWPNAGSCGSTYFMTAITNGTTPTCAQVQTFSTSQNGVVPAPPSNSVTLFLNANGGWSTPSGASITGNYPISVSSNAISLTGLISAGSGGTGTSGGTGFMVGNGSSPVSYTTTIPFTSLSGMGANIAVLGTNGSSVLTANTGTLPNNISGNAATASHANIADNLTNTPNLCPSGQYPRGVDTAGNASNCSSPSVNNRTCNSNGCYTQSADGTIHAWGNSTNAPGSGSAARLSITFPLTFASNPIIQVTPNGSPGGDGNPHPMSCHIESENVFGATAVIAVPQQIGGSGYASPILSSQYCAWTADGNI